MRDPDLTSSVDGSYRAKRLFDLTLVGGGGDGFGMLKYRTTVDADDEHPPLDDPRTTAQVSGRNYLDWAERLAVDLDYVDAQSPREDFRLILATLRAALGGHGAELPDDRDSDGYWLGPSESPLHEGER